MGEGGRTPRDVTVKEARTMSGGLWRREERKRQGQMMMIRIRPEEEGERATSTGRERLSRLGGRQSVISSPNII